MGFVRSWCRLATAVMLTVAAFAVGDVAAEAPPENLSWGRPAGSLQAALAAEGEVTVGGPARFRVALTTVGSPPGELGPVEDAFGWFLIVQKAGAKRIGYYSEMIALEESRRTPSPDGSTGEVIHFGALDLAEGKAFASKHGRALLTAYLEGEPSAALPKPAGTWGELLAPGPAIVKFTLSVPQPLRKPVVVRTAGLAVEVASPDLGRMNPARRHAYLLRQFDRDAFSAKRAYEETVGLGPPIVPVLIEAVAERARPHYSRMWMTAALADIRDRRAVRALVELLDDPADGVRNVVAYHGPKQQSPALDAAILRQVESGESGLVAWALLGFLVFRGEVPEKAMKAGIESDDPSARATVAEALAGHRTHETVDRLVALLMDENERVRGVAATVLARMDARGPKVLGALVAAIDRPGESARQRISEALATLTRKPWTYDPQAEPASRREVLEAWKQWWAERSGRSR
jgi:hypothetical protein